MKPSILAPEQNAASYNQVTRVVQRIVNSNQDLDFIKKQTWTIVVVQSKEANAFVLPVSQDNISLLTYYTYTDESVWPEHLNQYHFSS